MEIKIVSWNIDFKKTDKSNLWNYIDDKINPDILLLQECKEYPKSYHGVGELIGGSRPWGSFILSKKYSLIQIPVPNHNGWVIGARTTVNGQELSLFSIHAKLKDVHEKGHYVVPHLEKIFNDIMTVVGDTQNLIISGDFNADREFDKHNHQPEGTKHNHFFDWVENNLGLINSTKEYFKKTVQTIFTSRQKHPYQDDYIFLSKNLRNKLKYCKIPNRKDVEKLSDHSPVIITLAL